MDVGRGRPARSGDRDRVIAVRAPLLGVPEITPVPASSASPAGSAGAALNVVAVPVTAGDSGVIAWPCTYVDGDT